MPPKKVSAAATAAAVAAAAQETGGSCRSSQQQSSTSTTDIMASPQAKQTVIDELLTYIVFYKDLTTPDKLRRCLIRNFISVDIFKAKVILIKLFADKLEHPTLSETDTVETDADDVVKLVKKLDEIGILSDVQFVAADLNKLPKYNPNEVNMSYVIEREDKLNDSVHKLKADLSELKESLTNTPKCDYSTGFSAIQESLVQLQRQYDIFSRSMSLNITDLLSTCTRTNEQVEQRCTPAANDDNDDVDRSLNVVVFGLNENRDMVAWRDELNDVFQYVVGREVEITDSFRLGRFTEGKVRPILVKLKTAWDRRLLLHSSNKLRNYHQRVYLCPDESLQVRRKKTMDRLKYRAERERKTVVVENGILLVNNSPVFSLSDGHLTSN